MKFLSEKEIQIRKLGNAINYMVLNTSSCKKTKLFKLLFYLDFVKFKRCGKPFFNLEYEAWPLGPVPKEIFFDLKDFQKSDLSIYFDINDTGEECSFIPKKEIDMEVFSLYDKDLLDEIARTFKSKNSVEIVEKTHFKNDPWDITRKTKGPSSIIDYTTAIDGFGESISKVEAEEALEFLHITKTDK